MTSSTQHIANLTPLKTLKVCGADASPFLQGQLTNDVNQLTDRWQFFGYCSPKGRLLSTGFMWQTAGAYYLAMHTDIFANTLARLRMYVLRSKVEMTEVVLDMHAQLEQGMGEFGRYEFRAETHILHCLNHSIRISLADSREGKQPEHSATHVAWEDLIVSEGLPLITAATVEEFVPQMVNLELLGGVSFKKGCYTGQEIVARMHYLGKLKQRMLRYDISTDSPQKLEQLVIGAKLTAQMAAADAEADDHSELAALASTEPARRIAGQIIALDSARSFALVVVRTDYLATPLELSNDINVRFNPTTLPYAPQGLA